VALEEASDMKREENVPCVKEIMNRKENLKIGDYLRENKKDLRYFSFEDVD
jgi:hypothetical protein